MFQVILLNFPLPLVFVKDTFTKENICDLVQVGDDPEAVAEAEDEHEEDEHHGDVLVPLVPVAVPSCGRALKLKINHQRRKQALVRCAQVHNIYQTNPAVFN